MKLRALLIILLSLMLVLGSHVAQGSTVPLPDRSMARASIAEGAHALVQPDVDAAIAPDFGTLPLSFAPNAGQSNPAVRFQARSRGGTLFFTPNEVVLSLPAPARTPDTSGRLIAPARTPDPNGRGRPGHSRDVPTTPPAPPAVARLRFEGANPAPEVSGIGQLPGTVNYFIGNDATKWRTNLPTYAGIVYRELYPGVDLRYNGTEGMLKGTYVVSPGADPSRFRWRYDGATSVRVDEATGDLLIRLSAETGAGNAAYTLTERAPIAWQSIDGRRVPVTARYAIADDGSIGFALGDYDPNHPLMLDPELIYSTYLGGSSTDGSTDIAVDSTGNIYVTGWTYSTDFPTANPYDGALSGSQDAFVAKLNAAGSALLYSTYLGGSNSDEGTGIAVDGAGNAYVTGRTNSTDFPTVIPLQPTNSGGWDAFVVKINASGSTLIYGTYLGGSSIDRSTDIAVDSTGCVYITGETDSTNFPTANPLDSTRDGWDAFVAKLNAAGSALIYSTYLGGSGSESGRAVAVDSAGRAYVTGYTTSTNFPTVNPLQPANNGGPHDVFIAALNAAGSPQLFGTYLGGSGVDTGEDIAVDGYIHVTGQTRSTDFPTKNPLQPGFEGGVNDAFVVKLLPGGTDRLIYSTYLGGGDDDSGAGIAVDGAGSAYVTGFTQSTDFPADLLFGMPGGGRYAFVTKLSQDGIALLYNALLGGSNLQDGKRIAVDGAGNAYIVGGTESTNFPTEAPLDGTLGGQSDAFVTRLSDAPPPDIRIEPNSLSFDLSSQSVTVASQPSARSSGVSTPKILLSNGSSLILDFVMPMAESRGAEINDEVYQRLVLPGEGLTDEIGRPQLPALGRWIAVPVGTSATMQILDATFTVLRGYRIYPAQKPLTDQGPIEPGFSLDTDFYQCDAFYPQLLAVLEPPVDMRGTRAATLRVYPFQHNAKTGALRVYSHVRVKINFVQDSTAASSDLRPRSPYFDELYRGLLLNYDEALATPLSSSEMSHAVDGCDFLIITAPQFETAANALATWRNQQGIATQVRTTDDTGTTAAAIQAYIQDAYDTWSPQPSFVLLLGDAEFIPPHYRTTHPFYGTELGTDLYYSTVEGADYFPDISLGRISVDTAVQAGKAISDIIDYERNPVTDADFYSRAAIAGFFQDYGTLSAPKDGYEDRRFVLTSEEIRDYLITQGYNVQRIYTTESSVTPTHYNNGTYAHGEPLPAELLRANGFPWDGDRTDVSNAVNAGIFMLNHRDHGAFWGWGDPRFTVGDVNSLTNGDKLPVVFSINCETGWFDNETDHTSHNTGHTDIGFAEAWQRNPNGGAVGVIASTRVSYSGHNDTMAKGFYDAIWSNFLPYTPLSGRFSNPQRHMGNVLNYGKLYYASQYGDSTYRKIEFEEFHYFGDPTTQIWTAPPSRTRKTFTIYNDGDADLRVTDITKQNNSCWLNVATGSGVPLIIPPSGSKIVVVTVNPDCASAGTHNDRLLVYSNDPNENPYPDGVNVSLTIPSVIEVVYENADVDSDTGNEDGAANPGERITMDIALRNLGNDSATDVSAVLSSTSPYVDILDANIFYSVIGRDPVEGDENDTVQFEISPDTPGGTVIVFNLRVSASNGGPWQHEFAVVVAPDTTSPYIPSSPSPASGASGQPLNISLTWTGGDPDGDQVTYDVYVSTEHPLVDLSMQDLGCIGVTTPTCDVELAPGTMYFWYVIATDEHNATTSGPVWDLATINPIFLPVVLRQHP